MAVSLLGALALTDFSQFERFELYSGSFSQVTNQYKSSTSLLDVQGT